MNWDLRGIGSVPNQVDLSYFGFEKPMTYSEFRSLVPAGNWNEDTIEYVKQAVLSGTPVAPPFLSVEWTGSAWQVIDHEGRSRSDAAHFMDPDSMIPVSILPRGFRARHLTPEMLGAKFLPQKA